MRTFTHCADRAIGGSWSRFPAWATDARIAAQFVDAVGGIVATVLPGGTFIHIWEQNQRVIPAPTHSCISTVSFSHLLTATNLVTTSWWFLQDRPSKDQGIQLKGGKTRTETESQHWTF